ncbi:MAG: RDD family protein, partial [Actinobacteria bacterium]|nr:RDD family protein [Actinomycetota bacterium]
SLGRTPSGTPWTHNPWIVAVFVVAVAMQAYGGATPGKLVAGIAVVGEDDARPLGLVRTLLRWAAHLVDAILLIGYLRPLWHPKRKTFADSIVGSVVLVTRRPLPHRWFAPRADRATHVGPPLVWQAAQAPGWRPWATWVSVVACGLGVLLSGGFSSTVDGAAAEARCTMTTADTGSVSLAGATLHQSTTTVMTTRLGITRQTEPPVRALSVTWALRGTLSSEDWANLNVTLTGTNGVSHSESFSLVDSPGNDPTTTLTVDDLDRLGQEWTWTASVEVNGVESPACTGTGPAA